MSLGNRLIAYLESLTITGGDCDGEPFTVLPWERRFLKGTFSRTGDSALSIARGNGKSAVTAAVAAAVVDPEGPLHGTRHEVLCNGKDFEQGVRIFRDVLGYLRAKGYDLTDRKVWRKQFSANRAILEHLPTEALIRCLGSDPGTAEGQRPFLWLADEPAAWPSSTRDQMLSVIRTGLGKTPGSRLIVLGTRSAEDAHFFSKMLNGGAAYAQTHAAKIDDPPFQRRTWLKANPSLPILPSLEKQIRDEADQARRDPAALASFRAKRLNLGVHEVESSPLLPAGLWEELAEHQAEVDDACLWGVDLGGSAASSAVAGFWPFTGRLDAVAAFAESPSLADRGLRDGVGNLYVTCHQRGELLAVGEMAVSYRALLGEALRRFGKPEVVVCDAWKLDVLKQTLIDVGLRNVPVITRRFGPKDGSEDVLHFRRACYERRVHPTKNVFLASAVGQAYTISDPSGNQRLCKGAEGDRRARARDDAAAAAILAVSLSERTAHKPSSRGVYLGLVG